jgi:guanine deaminase
VGSHLEHAARLAREAVESGQGGPFGAVIVDAAGKVIGAAGNRVLANNDPTAHAEVEAIREACAAIGDYRLTGCTIYTTCEPCPMCLAAIHWARLEKIVYSLTRGDAAAIGFDDEVIYRAMQSPLIPMEQEPCPAAKEAFRRNHVHY